MGHIRRARSGNGWEVRWLDPNRRERAKTYRRKVDAERFLASVEAAKQRGEYVDPALGRLQLDEWAPRWFAGVAPTLTAKTRGGYQSLLRSRILPALGKRQLASLRRSDVQSWVAEMQGQGLSSSRIRQAVIVLALALDAAVHDGYVGRNAARGVKLPPVVRREAAYFAPSVVDAIADQAGEHGLLIRVMGVLGLRWGEAVGLRRRHVDLLRRRLIIDSTLSEVGGGVVEASTKAHAVRQVPIPPQLAEDLAEALGGRVGPSPVALIFTAPGGGPLRHSYFSKKVWRPALAALGLPHAGMHALRHSAAARMIEAGASPKAVQVILGHASYAFTLTVYGHLFDAELDGLAERLEAPRDLDGIARIRRSGKNASPPV